MLYLEERYEQVDEKIKNFYSFPPEIKKVLEENIDVFDTQLRRSMNVALSKMNLREGSMPYASHSCQPTPVHFKACG